MDFQIIQIMLNKIFIYSAAGTYQTRVLQPSQPVTQQRRTSGLNLTNILPKAFMLVDPEIVKNAIKSSVSHFLDL